MYRFLLKPNWLAAHLLVISLALALSSLGFWQLKRLEQTKSHNKELIAKMGQETKSLAELAKEYNFESDIEQLSYLPIKLLGYFDPDNEVLLRGRSYAGQAGYNIFTPFITDNFALMVERGWVPINYDTPPIKEALPVSTKIEIIGRIYPSQEAPLGWLANLAPKDPKGELKITAYTSTKRLQKQIPYDLVPFYIKLEEQNPKHSLELPLKLIIPEINNGTHLGYALQWFSFVLIGLIGYALIVRKRILSGQV